MKLLERIHLVQFSFFEADTFETRGNIAFLGPNGVGKTSLLDAVQIAMLGAHGNFTAFNSQSVSARNKRTLRDYCLGVIRSSEEQKGDVIRKRDHAHTYITLVFRDTETGESVSAGVCISATMDESDHDLRGLYVLPGVSLSLDDHLQATDEGSVPLDWSAFAVELNRQAKAHGRTAHISVHPESYIEELLHAIQPSARHIDRRAFVRAFKKSMHLKDIESVNDFVREHIAEAQAINRQGALTQISRFKQLNTLIKETEDQIAKLEAIHREQEQLLRTSRKRGTLIALKVKLATDIEKDALEQLRQQRQTSEAERQALVPTTESLEQRRRQLRKELETVIETAAADPDVLSSERNKKLWTTLKQTLATHERRLAAWSLQVRQTLHELTMALPDLDAQVRASLSNTAAQWEQAARENREVALTLLKETVELISSVRAPLARATQAARVAHSTSETTLKSLLGQAKMVSLGAGKPSLLVGAAIEIFREKGIDAKPVNALIEIKDRTWQAAIEAFLGRHRESLVVTPGKEREAIRILRHFRDADWPFDIMIVQPAHLKATQTPSPETVAALIAGTDDTAVRYVRQLLGNMRCVKDEEELERYSRALTADGMVSANGGTQRKRLPDAKDWQIGSKLTESKKNELHQQIIQAQRALDAAKNMLLQIEKTEETLRQTLRDLDAPDYADTITGIRSTREDLLSVPDPATAKEPERVAQLKKKRDEVDAEIQSIEKSLKDANDKLSAAQALISSYDSQIAGKEKHLATLAEEYRLATQSTDYDGELEPTLHRTLTSGFDRENWLSECEAMRTSADSKIQNLQARVLPEFAEFLSQYNVSLIDERTDWRKAMTWAESRISRLKESELVTYKEDAAQALRAAEETFRQDVAYRLREAMNRLEHNIAQLNKILEACPVFSSNERYKFEAIPAKAYEKIHKFIMDVDDLSGTGSLFQGDENTRAEILKLLEESASDNPKRPENPLEDYRRMYTFDLLIYQDEKRDKPVDRLSRRMGVASNGEHRVPFYVIAGASLASAYRLAAGKPNTGAALILLDEAFYGIDSQNSYAVASFLRTLGFQLVMAGPEADKGKLAPMTHTLYEIERAGVDVFYEHEHFTAAMHSLMTSDMPMQNPDLVTAMEASLQEGMREQAS